MAGTKEGAIKARNKLLEKDPNYYVKMGQSAGKAKSKNKGFGSASKTMCTCDWRDYPHNKAQCIGARGGNKRKAS